MGVAEHLVMNGIIMKSINFEFLRDNWPELASRGGFAEQYALPDPQSSLVKLRSFRSSIGMEAKMVNERFVEFISAYPALTSTQVSFLNLLNNHISRYGSIEIEQLYEPPFTTLNSDGLDGVFIDEDMVENLIRIIDTFRPQTMSWKESLNDIP